MKVKKAMVVLAAALAGLGLTACGGGATVSYTHLKYN